MLALQGSDQQNEGCKKSNRACADFVSEPAVLISAGGCVDALDEVGTGLTSQVRNNPANVILKGPLLVDDAAVHALNSLGPRSLELFE